MCDVLSGGPGMCDKVWQGRGSKLAKNSVTYFMDGPKWHVTSFEPLCYKCVWRGHVPSKTLPHDKKISVNPSGRLLSSLVRHRETQRFFPKRDARSSKWSPHYIVEHVVPLLSVSFFLQARPSSPLTSTPKCGWRSVVPIHTFWICHNVSCLLESRP